MRIFIGADHRGFSLKESLKKWLSENGIEHEDLGAYEFDPKDDYPIYAERVAEKISDALKNSTDARGILICGSGIGVDIVANKFEGIRSGLGINIQQVTSARRDDNINVLAIAADETESEDAVTMLASFIETEFVPSASHARRLNEIEEIEKKT